MDNIRKNDDMDKFIAYQINKGKCWAYLLSSLSFIVFFKFVDGTYFSSEYILAFIAIVSFSAERIIPIYYPEITLYKKYHTEDFLKSQYIYKTKQIGFTGLFVLIIVTLIALFKNME